MPHTACRIPQKWRTGHQQIEVYYFNRLSDVNKPTRILRKVSLMAFTDSVKLTYFLFQNKHCVFCFSWPLPEIQLNVPGSFCWNTPFTRKKNLKCSDNSMGLNVLLENKGEAKSIKRMMRNVGNCYQSRKPPCWVTSRCGVQKATTVLLFSAVFEMVWSSLLHHRPDI